ncbi:MAG TPA: 2Fe-2S iron-sulfur cluster-binding protein, partial [Myxococcaceae bacterium]
MHFKVTVNGKELERHDAREDDLLIDFLHEEGLTGTKFSCGIGQCGSCKVAVQAGKDPEMIPVLACFARLDSIQGMRVTTVEGLHGRGKLHPLQDAFLKGYAFQCGYSTPGMLMAGHILIERLRHQPVETRNLDREITSAISGHVCRCTGYIRYYQAIKDVILSWGGKALVKPSARPPKAG